MTNTEIWTSLESLANKWRKSSVVRNFNAELPSNNPLGSKHLRAVSKIQERGNPFDTNPIQVYKAFPHLGFPLDYATQEFMSNSELIERAVSMTTCWLRSRLPGYPLFPAPQLARNSYHTAQDNNFHVPWFKECLAAGLQFDNTPRDVSDNLRVDADRESVALANALAKTSEWQLFKEAASSITPDVRRELLDARAKLTQRLRQETQDTLQPEDPRIFVNQRLTATSNLIAELSQPAKYFANAFDRVDQMINLVATDVFTQLLCYGSPSTLSGTSNLEIEPGNPPNVTFDLAGDAAHVCRIYWVDHPIVKDAIRIQSFSVQTNLVHGTHLKTSGSILVGSSESWT